jgi:hypothetical protein
VAVQVPCAAHTTVCRPDGVSYEEYPPLPTIFAQGVDFERPIPKLCGAVWITLWFLPYVF